MGMGVGIHAGMETSLIIYWNDSEMTPAAIQDSIQPGILGIFCCVAVLIGIGRSSVGMLYLCLFARVSFIIFV